MRISYLELRNYRRFREVKVQFPDGIVGIIGSNGSGKTTLIEGIAWALFGNTEEVVRTSRESIKRAGAGASESCSAVLEFELGGSDYRIEREMGGKSLTMKASLRTGATILAEGDKPVKKAVEKLIGMDHKSFFTSVFARQKELNALQNVAAGERKKAVLRMLRIDGIDDVIQKVRADRRDVEERIKGAEGTLLDDQGRDREAIVKGQLPDLRSALAETETLLKAAEEAEGGATRAFEETRVKRDELRKDFDAYNTTAKDVHAKRSSVAELDRRAESLGKRADEARKKLARLPELEAAERAWSEATAATEKLEEDRRKDDKAKHLTEDLRADRATADGLGKELSEAAKTLSGGEDLEVQKSVVERSREESEKARVDISDKLGEQRARKREREGAAAKDRAKLEEILRLGKEGRCPTCERRLDEAYDLLAAKLAKEIDEATAASSDAAAKIEAFQTSLKALDRKDDALKKKASHIEQESDRRRKAEATAEGLKRQLAQLEARIASKSNELSALGELRFSKEAYDKAKSEKERLKPLHDDFVRLKGTEEELNRVETDRAEVRDRTAKLGLEVEALSRLIVDLEPKKAQYDKILKIIEEKMDTLSKAKDEARSRSSKRDSARNALQSAEKDLENIERVKKSIEAERRRKDDLASLEDVMVSFRDHLIGKVAPTLAELTSHVLESTTGGRYGRVELDESYEIQVDDEGALHPLGRFSGGESDLANLALRLAISRIIAERTGANPINFLILDEIFGSLDPDRKRSVMTALTGLSAQFRQIFLITHIEDIKDLMGYVMTVEQAEDGTSTVTLAS
jgi:exonuclease SbcC